MDEDLTDVCILKASENIKARFYSELITKTDKLLQMNLLTLISSRFARVVQFGVEIQRWD